MCSNNKQFLSDLNDALIESASSLSDTLRAIDSPHACSVRKIAVSFAYQEVVEAFTGFHKAVVVELAKTLTEEEVKELRAMMTERMEEEVQKTVLNSLASDVSPN